MREEMETGRVAVNPLCEFPFRQREYRNVAALIREVMADYFEKETENNVIIAACDNRHNELIYEVASGQKTVFSLFQKRNGMKEFDQSIFHMSDLIVTDTEYMADYVRTFPGAEGKNILDLSPYDVRVALGKSQRVKETKILCFLGCTQKKSRRHGSKSFLFM